MHALCSGMLGESASFHANHAWSALRMAIADTDQRKLGGTLNSSQEGVQLVMHDPLSSSSCEVSQDMMNYSQDYLEHVDHFQSWILDAEVSTL